MGQKVNPIGLRLGINRTWDSRWFSRKEYGNQLLDDLKLRGFLGKRLGQAAVSKVLRDAYGVSDALRARVQASMEKLNYRPHAGARAASRGAW